MVILDGKLWSEGKWYASYPPPSAEHVSKICRGFPNFSRRLLHRTRTTLLEAIILLSKGNLRYKITIFASSLIYQAFTS